MDAFSIGQLAKAVGVPISTLRFYERIGMLKPDFRTGANYRGYTSASLDRLRFMRSAQASGLSLEDIKALLQLTHSTQPPCDAVLSLLRSRRGEIQKRIKELHRVEQVLAKALRACCQGESQDICSEVCRLAGADVVLPKPQRKKLRQSA